MYVKYRDLNPRLGTDLDTLQRLVEGQHLDQRLSLQKYELPVEGQRHHIHTLRQAVLEGKTGYSTELERLVTLRTIDDLWSDYLARLAEFRSGLPWLDWRLSAPPGLALDRRDAQYEYAQKIHEWFSELEAELPVETARRLKEAQTLGVDPRERGALWTYLTTDQPFGSWASRFASGLRRKFGA